MNKTIRLSTLASLLAFGLPASTIYMSTQPGSDGAINQIATLNPATGASTGVQGTVADGSAVGFGIASGTSLEFFDIAVNNLNEIYGVTRHQSSGSLTGTQQLWKVNAATGVAQLIAANLSGAQSTINGLAFNPGDNRLYFSGSSGTIFSTDLGACALGSGVVSSCTFAAANTTALATNSRGDIAFHTNGTGGYDLFFGGEGTGPTPGDVLLRLAFNGTTWVQTAASTPLTVLGGQFIIKGLASDGTNLYVGGDIFGGSATQAIALVNPSLLTLSGFHGITGVTSNVAGMAANANAVPEPSALVLSTIGLGLLAFGRRKFKS